MKATSDTVDNRISEEKHSVIMERLMKSGMIATTAFELISGGFEFYSGADNIQNIVEKEMDPLESSYIQYSKRVASDFTDALKSFDVMIPDEGDLQDVMNTQYEKNKESAELLEEEKRRKTGRYTYPRKNK